MDYYNDFMKNNARIYSSLVNKAINGERLTDNEYIFILNYRKDIIRSQRVSPFKKILNGAKEVISTFNDKTEEETNNGV